MAIFEQGMLSDNTYVNRGAGFSAVEFEEPIELVTPVSEQELSILVCLDLLCLVIIGCSDRDVFCSSRSNFCFGI
jgi:hypothetical protein